MAKPEGTIFEKIAWLWFSRNGYEIKKYQPTRGPDYLVLPPDKDEPVLYEIKGRQLINRYKNTYKIPYISVLNIDLEGVYNFLIIIYDNFANMFRFFHITYKELTKILGKYRTISIYRLLQYIENRGEIGLYDLHEVDLSTRIQHIPISVISRMLKAQPEALKYQYRKSALEDIEEAEKGIIAAVSSINSIEYHQTHITIEEEEINKIKDKGKQKLLQHHINSHYLSIELLKSKQI